MTTKVKKALVKVIMIADYAAIALMIIYYIIF